jgi:MATE family multidrug resistance protein
MKHLLPNRWKSILALAWPLIIANSFWNLQLTIDRIFLGTYSTEALGAAMAVMGVFWVPMALLQQTAAYITTFVSQYFGAKKFQNIGLAFWQSVFVSIIGGFGFLGLIFLSGPLFKLMGHSPITQGLEIDYFNALAYSALPTALVAAVSGYFTGIGRTTMVMIINFVGLISNVLFDYLLINGNMGFPALGIEGAGYATAIAAGCAAVAGIIVMFADRQQEDYHLGVVKFDWKLTSQFLKYGIPSGAQWALEGVAFTVFLLIMGRLTNGDAALASSSIAVTLMMLAVLPSMGVAQAVMTLVARKLGEKRPEDAAMITWDGVKISAIYIIVIATSFFLIPEFYLSWFKNDSNATLWSQVELIVPQLLMIVGVFTLFDSVYLNLSFALKGAGDTRFVSLVALAVPWPILVLPAALLMDHPNAAILSWMWVVAYSIVLTVILSYRFKKGKWKSMSITSF